MDIAAELQKLEDERAALRAWFENPITKAIVEDEKEQTAVASAHLDDDIVDVASLFSHIATKGHKRALSRWLAIPMDRLEEIDRQIKELEEQQKDEHDDRD